MNSSELNRQYILAQQSESLADSGLRYEIKDIQTFDHATGQFVTTKARVLVKPDQATVNAVVALSHEGPEYDIYPGIKALREQMNKEIANTPGCKGCVRGAILKKYLPRAIMLMQARKSIYESTNDPGTAQVPTSGGESPAGTPPRKTMLRRAAAYLAKVFRRGKTS